MPWEAWPPRLDAPIKTSGLLAVAETTKDADRAVRAYRRILELLPDSSEASDVRCRALPDLFLSRMDAAGAGTEIEKLAQDAPALDRAHLLAALGDLRAAAGAYDEAAKRWAEAAEALAKAPRGAATADLENGTDPAGNEMLAQALQGDLAARGRIGRPLGDVADPQWSGASAPPLSALRGRVVAVWAGGLGKEAFAGWAEFDAKTAALADRGVTAFALTSYASTAESRTCWMPSLMEGGRPAQVNVREADFVRHLDSVRTRLRGKGPIGVVDDAALAPFRTARKQTITVLDAEGLVAVVGDGARPARGIALARHVLARPPAVAAPK